MRRFVIQNEDIEVRVELRHGRVLETYRARADGSLRIVAQSAPGGLGAVSYAGEPDTGERRWVLPDYSPIATRIMKSGKPLADLVKDIPPEPTQGPVAPRRQIRCTGVETIRLTNGEQQIVVRGDTDDGVGVERRISLSPGERCVRIEVKATVSRPTLLERMEDRMVFGVSGAPDFTWLPHLKFEEADLSPDWTWKAPSAIVQKGSLMMALVPDLDWFRETKILDQCNAALDLDIRGEAPLLSCGLVPSYPHGHNVFKHIPGTRCLVLSGSVGYAYSLCMRGDVVERQAHRIVARFLWSSFGARGFREAHGAQRFTFARWEEKTWHEYADRVWRDIDRDGLPCGSLQCLNFGIPGDAWFCGWWNNMRTAYGLALYGRRRDDREAMDRARRIMTLALSAPRDRGAFPVLLVLAPEGWRWERDHVFGGYVECYHTYDMSWTSYWLLRWLQDLDPQNQKIPPLCRDYGDLLLQLQQESGFIPSFLNEDLSLRAGTRLNREGAEPSVSALFLIELANVTQEEKYLAAAVKAMEYIQAAVVPENRWFDFETFLSCSPKPYDFFDPITGQHPQNNLGVMFTAKALLALYTRTSEDRYLAWGRNVLDYLSLTQQVWSHPRLSPNLFGGFTTQNTDSEWSDARQADCALIYLEYFRVTGEQELLERGIAALRAGFAVAPSENYAHIGCADLPGAVSGIHWGQGSAMTSAEIVRSRYGDIWVDIENRRAVGVNGCTVSETRFAPGSLTFSLVTTLAWDTPARLVAQGAGFDLTTVAVNGHLVGRFTREELARGVNVPPGIVMGTAPAVT